MKLLNTILCILICIPLWVISLIGAIWIGKQSITDQSIISFIALIVGMIWCIGMIVIIPMVVYFYIKSNRM